MAFSGFRQERKSELTSWVFGWRSDKKEVWKYELGLMFYRLKDNNNNQSTIKKKKKKVIIGGREIFCSRFNDQHVVENLLIWRFLDKVFLYWCFLRLKSTNDACMKLKTELHPFHRTVESGSVSWRHLNVGKRSTTRCRTKAQHVARVGILSK